jgi:polysaccharide biosynthesis transport protein
VDVPATPPASDASEPALDVMPYVRALWRRKWVIAAAAALAALLGAAYALRQPKVYSASTSIIIDVAAPRFLDADVKEVMGDERSNYWFNREYYETQAAVITSRAVAERVVQSLGLQSDAGFLGLEQVADPAERKRALAGADAASLLRSRIRVIPEKNSRVLHIAVEDLDPKRAALLANEVAEAYKQQNLELKRQTSRNARDWLARQIEELELASRQSEMEVFHLKKDADILTSTNGKEQESPEHPTKKALQQHTQALVEVDRLMATLKARAAAIRRLRESRPDDLYWAEGLPAAQAPQLNELRAKLLEQRAACLELEQRYLDGHPKLEDCRRQQGLLEQELRRRLDNLVQAAEIELAQAQAERRELELLVERTKLEAYRVYEKELNLQRQQRVVDNNQRLYAMVLKRYKDLELSGQQDTTNVRVLDEARPVPVPVRPNVRALITLFALVGLLLAVAGTLAQELLDASVLTREDVEESLRLPFLGSVPLLDSKGVATPDLVVHSQPRSQAAESFRALRTNLLFMSPDRPFRALVVTSAGPAEGKSTIAINLAIAMAQAGHKVLLLDTDLRRPRLHKAFHLQAQQGVSSLVVGQGTLEQVAQATEVPGLTVLPCGPLPPNPAELLHTRAFAELLQRLRERYDLVLLDSPPIGPVSDALVLARQADGVLLVLKAGTTHREAARSARRALVSVQARLLGGVLNQVNLKDPRYAAGYHAYSGYEGYYGGRDEQQKVA